MNDICEMWHLPWHALQKDLALGLNVDALGPAPPTAKPVSVQSATVAAVTWLGRARQRAAPRAVADRRSPPSTCESLGLLRRPVL